MSAALQHPRGATWTVHPLRNGGFLLVWPTWAGLSDHAFMAVVNSLMGNNPERWTVTATDSPVDNHGAWLIEPI